MEALVDGFVDLNINGAIKDLCETYYSDDIVMLNEGEVFASSRVEAWEKQKEFVDKIASKNIQLISKTIKDNISELVFDYKMITHDNSTVAFKGKHIQRWNNNKIIHEAYQSVQ